MNLQLMVHIQILCRLPHVASVFVVVVGFGVIFCYCCFLKSTYIISCVVVIIIFMSCVVFFNQLLCSVQFYFIEPFLKISLDSNHRHNRHSVKTVSHCFGCKFWSAINCLFVFPIVNDRLFASIKAIIVEWKVNMLGASQMNASNCTE